MQMSKYVRLCRGLKDNGVLIRPEEIDSKIQDYDKDYYVSVYYYTEDHYKTFLKKKSIRGIVDVVTDKLVFDFDSKDNLEQARADTLKAIQRLSEYGVKEENIEIYFSGSKGFTVLTKLPKLVTPEQLGSIAINKIGKDLTTLDESLYNASRILRVPGTKHNDTGLYKIPLTMSEINILSIDGIKELATQSFVSDPAAVSQPKEELFHVEKVKEEPKYETPNELDLSVKSPQWKDYKWALLQGFFESGERHNAMMVIAATCRGLGYDKDTAFYMCKAASEKQAARYNTTPFDEDELRENIIEQSVFSPYWEGGQFSYKNSTWLQAYCRRMNLVPKDEEDEKLYSLSDIEAGFTNYVQNIDANTILTGIARLDKAMPLTIGMNLGIVGAASSGKCLGKNTPVRMFNGSVKMVQDIKVDDLLMGDDSMPRKVLSTCSGKEKLYKVNQTMGDSYVVNASHILSLKTTENKGFYQKGQILDINIEEFLKKSNDFQQRFYGYRAAVDYPEMNVEIDPYYLGLWLGDGSSYSTSLYTKDKEIVDFNEQYAKKLELTPIVRIDKRTGVQNVCIIKKNKTNHLRTTMIKMGLLKGRKKNDQNYKHIPKNYLTNSKEIRFQLLAGLMDSDGHTKNKLSNFTIVQSRKELASQILELVQSLGFNCSLKEIYKAATNGDNVKRKYYQVYFSSDNYSGFTKYMRLERKKPKKGTLKKVNCSRLTFEDLGEGEYYGFEIDGNHRFLLKDYTVTHNTAIALEILKNTSKAGVVSVFASLDMHRNRLFEKLLYKSSNLSRDEIYTMFREGKGHELTKKIKEDYGNVYFYDRSCPNVADIRKYIAQIEQETGKKVKLVMVDYFERINSERSEDTAASKDVAGQLQDLVNDLNVCLVTLVQPNKFSLSGGPDTPITSYTAIKGSSFLYQSFRSIISIWRPFFTPELKDNDKYLQMAILKNDLGEVNLFNFGWHGKTGAIFELQEEQEDELYRLLDAKEDKKKKQKEESGW